MRSPLGRTGELIGELIGEFLAELVVVVLFMLVTAAGIAAFDRSPIIAGFAIYGSVTVVGRLRHRNPQREAVTAVQRFGIGALIAVALWLNYELLT